MGYLGGYLYLKFMEEDLELVLCALSLERIESANEIEV